jgi:circadian clock protein KaiC
LTSGSDSLEETAVGISSLVDAWLLLRDIESGGERNRGLYILKARGLAHSNQIRELLITDHGIELREPYLGEAGLLTGSARVTQEAKDATGALGARQEIERREFLLERKRKALEAQIAALQLEIETETQESRQFIAQEDLKLRKFEQDRDKMAASRSVKSGRQPDESQSIKKRGGPK